AYGERFNGRERYISISDQRWFSNRNRESVSDKI
ncbi:uncharacterized protein METZ01_LOCUS99170, partial [marine metagenome]